MESIQENRAVNITDNLCAKNPLIFGSKSRGLQLRAGNNGARSVLLQRRCDDDAHLDPEEIAIFLG